MILKNVVSNDIALKTSRNVFAIRVAVTQSLYNALLEKCWLISQYVTDDAIAKQLFVT